MSSGGFVKGIILPDLDFDSESSDEEKGSEPLIFHPTLHRDQPLKTALVQEDPSLNQDTVINNNKFAEPVDVHISNRKEDNFQTVERELSNENLPATPEKLLKSDALIELSSPILPAEIEIDDALLSCGVLLKGSLEAVESLTDSGSSGSSLMEKLEATAGKGRDTNMDNICNGKNESLLQTITKQKKNSKQNVINETVHIDLTENEISKESVHPSVMRRYGSMSPSNGNKYLEYDADEVESLLQERARLKQESEKILRHNQLDSKTITKTEPPRVAENMIRSVDSMLENVSRILYEQADPGEDLDVSTMLCNGLENVEKKGVKTKNSTLEESVPQRTENISTSIFTNSFLSASPKKEMKPNQSSINTKPKRNILGSRSKKETKASNNFQELECDKKEADDLVKSTDALIHDVNIFKEELNRDIAKDFKDDKRLQRRISFEENMVNGTHISNSTNCLACFPTNLEETPLKAQHTCEKGLLEELPLKSKKKETRSMGCSTDGLLDDMVSLSVSNDNKKMLNVENEKVDVTTDNSAVTTATVATKNSKNKKKKKNKANKTASNNISTTSTSNKIEVVAPVLSEKKQELVKELKKLADQDKRKMLFDKTVSFDAPFSNLPNTNKQLLLLKISLESPGLCKTTKKDAVFSYLEASASDNFIGLVTLFVALLQGSKWEVQSIFANVPFDVVSMQQVFFDGEFYLMVGIAENQNTNHIKTKRTKLGTNFFHAVSHFLNTNTLEDILEKICQQTESEKSRRIGWASNVWNQIESRKYIVPGSGKLSGLINILPDTHALQKLLAVKPSLFVHSGEKKLNFDEVSHYNQAFQKQEVTCITINNILSLSPKHMCDFLLRLRKESVEICALKIGYEQTGGDRNQPTLAVGINEVKAATVLEGRALLSDCDELKEIPISFHSSSRITSSQNKLPAVNYVINETYSQKEVVRWFGPCYSDEEVDELTENLKSITTKNNSSKSNSKKKSIDDSISRLSLFVTYSTYAVLLLSTKVPSIFVSFIAALASKNGLQLKAINKNAVTSSQLSALGIPERQVNVFGYSQPNVKKPSSTSGVMNSFCSMMFYGNSAVYRLHGLIEKLTFILNNSLTGETLENLIDDPSFTYPPSHNVDLIFHAKFKLNRPSTDYFVALNYNQATQDLFSNLHATQQMCIEEIFPTLSNIGLNNTVPELNLATLVIYGKELINNIPSLLAYLFGDIVYANLKSWRESKRSTSAAIQYTPISEMLGIKYISSLSKQQASFLATGEALTKLSERSTNALTSNDVVLIVLRYVDRKSLSTFKEKLNKKMPVSHLLGEYSNIICHTDVEYVCRLLFLFFHPNEIHPDNIRDRTQAAPAILSEEHSLFTVVDKIYNLNLMENVALKKPLPKKNENNLNLSHLPHVSNVYQIHPLTLGYPLQLLLQNEETFTGLTIEYSTHHMIDIVRCIARVCRMGFKIVGLKFPAIDSYSTSIHIIFKREDAIFVLCKLRKELENEYEKLKLSICFTPEEVNNFIRKEFKNEHQLTGGIFKPTYATLLNEVAFVKDTAIDGRDKREIEWTSNKKSSTAESFNFMKSSSLSGTILTAGFTEEVNIILLPSPLLNGIYLNQVLPRECTFPEVWHRFESICYRTIAAKMTMLNEADAMELADTLELVGKRKRQVVRLVSTKPFVTLVMIGHCVLSDFWLNVNRQFVDDDAVTELKKHAVVATKREQVDILMRTFFKQVLDNQKVVIKNLLV